MGRVVDSQILDNDFAGSQHGRSGKPAWPQHDRVIAVSFAGKPREQTAHIAFLGDRFEATEITGGEPETAELKIAIVDRDPNGRLVQTRPVS